MCARIAAASAARLSEVEEAAVETVLVDDPNNAAPRTKDKSETTRIFALMTQISFGWKLFNFSKFTVGKRGLPPLPLLIEAMESKWGQTTLPNCELSKFKSM